MSTNRLLVIDDEPDVAATIGRVARRAGFDAIITTDGEDFLARASIWRPTVIALDLAMPHPDGKQLLAELARRSCDSQILIVSGHERRTIEEVRAYGVASGLNIAGILQKPLRAEELRTALRVIYDDAGVISVADLVNGMNANQFTLEYQPMVDLRGARPVGLEALARWHHPKRGLILPDIFIDLLEESDAILAFTRSTIGTAVSQARQWEDEGLTLGVAINISGRCCGALDLDEIIAASCSHYRIPHDRVTVEITETAAMIDEARAIASLYRLKEMGVHLSIDDFGTGYSSLVQLHRLPFSEIKIDKSFVGDCLINEESRIIVGAIIELAHNLNRVVVAEGIESQEVLDYLRQLGCDIGQGYFFGRPMPGRQVREWFRNWDMMSENVDDRAIAVT